MVRLIQLLYNSWAFFLARNRARAWGLFTHSMGQDVFVFERARFLSPAGTSLGSHITVNRGTDIDGRGGVTIGSYVLIGPNCQILSSNHEYRDTKNPIMLQGTRSAPIVIQDNVWLGANVVISPGVTIGSGSVIGANAVVTKDVPPNSICGGVPARVIKSRV